MKKLVFLTLSLVVLCLFPPAARAAEAPEITRECAFTFGGKKADVREMADGSYNTYFTARKGAVLTISSNGKPMSGLFLQFFDRATQTAVEVQVDDAWTKVATIGKHLTDWVAFPEGVTACRLTNESKARLFIAELSIYGEGDRPAVAEQWEDLAQADLMLVSCHPDDELLWFAGLLPTYAGERGLAVQVVCAVPSTPLRRLEMLDGLWHCGVKAYPAFLGFRDTHSTTMSMQYKYWSKKTVDKKLTEVLRRFRPAVVVTHDFMGEYGHGGHRVMADALARVIPKAANTAYMKDSAKQYGAWQVQKFYVHLYEKNQLRMNWRIPLTAFGGKDGFDVAKEAFQFHKSQVRNGWEMEEGGKLDNALFGLYYTTVGEDRDQNDLMENIDLSKTAITEERLEDQPAEEADDI